MLRRQADGPGDGRPESLLLQAKDSWPHAAHKAGRTAKLVYKAGSMTCPSAAQALAAPLTRGGPDFRRHEKWLLKRDR